MSLNSGEEPDGGKPKPQETCFVTVALDRGGVCATKLGALPGWQGI